jgi:hypothetical protein
MSAAEIIRQVIAAGGQITADGAEEIRDIQEGRQCDEVTVAP